MKKFFAAMTATICFALAPVTFADLESDQADVDMKWIATYTGPPLADVDMKWIATYTGPPLADVDMKWIAIGYAGSIEENK